MMHKLTRQEFYDVYGISLLENWVGSKDKKYLLYLILPIAKKYYDITYHALTAELRYFRRGTGPDGVNYSYELDLFNLKLLKKYKIKNWKTTRKKLPLGVVYSLFKRGNWEKGTYGGDAWAQIAKGCKNLKMAINSRDLKKIILAIDRLNDLEHNNALYLKNYVCFDIESILEEKKYLKSKNTFNRCSKEIVWLFKRCSNY